jgi:Thrombospondin type 3 repeat
MEGVPVVASHAAVRSALVLLVALAAAVAWAGSAGAEDPPPTVTLLSPADGAKVEIFAQQERFATLRFRVDFPAPPAEAQSIYLDLATDPGFVNRDGGETLTCAAGRQSCEHSYTSRDAYSPGERIYWRVRVASTTSVTWSFVAAAPPDRDRDSVPDELDNCPSRRNPKQEDMEADGKGDACQPDRVKPRVKAYSGSARRGSPAAFRFRVHDNRYVTIRATVRWRGQLALSGRMNKVAAPRWSYRATWWSRKPISSSWPVGVYQFCVVAVDGAGNRSKSCAPYRIS